MSVHRINLKGPWECELLCADSDGAQRTGNETSSQRGATSKRVTMPADWTSIFGPTAGRARFVRKFHKPTNLDAEERVFVVFEGVGGEGSVLLNDSDIGRIESSTTAQRFEVTRLLQRFNRLTVELSCNPAEHESRGGLYAPVALEISSDGEE